MSPLKLITKTNQLKYNIILFLFLSIISFAEIPAQETYVSHKVEKGETIFSISKKYGVSEAAIYQLNPDAQKGISENSLLIIPSVSVGAKVIGFTTHKVKRKETLFSISQKYGVLVDDLKKYNKELYSRGLKKGEKIQIPKFEKIIINTEVVDITSKKDNPETQVIAGTTSKIHEVLPKETFYGIARKYGITIAELKALNPSLTDDLPIGTKLNVPVDAILDSATIEEDRFDFYEVLPKEGFYRLKIKLGLTQEEIIALNPYAKEGLKGGMILKIPKEIKNNISENIKNTNLENSVLNPETKRLVVMLPFRLDAAVNDSLVNNKEWFKKNRTLRISLDFYSGVLMAADFAKEKGISVAIKTLDTEGSQTVVSSLMSSTNFSETDAVIGPLLSKNVELVASLLKSDNVAVFSPLSNRDLKLTNNLFQTLPSAEVLQDKMIDYLKRYSLEKNLVFIADQNSEHKTLLQDALPNLKILNPREKGFLYLADINAKMDNTKANWVILDSKNPVLVSNVVSLLNGMPENFKVHLFTLDRNEAYDFDDISNTQLANIKFTFPSVTKGYSYSEKDAFVVSYKNKYGVYPDRFAVRGFDLTYDVLLRLASSDNFTDAAAIENETQYVENKFRYKKELFSGYTNQACYLLRYTDKLEYEIVE